MSIVDQVFEGLKKVKQLAQRTHDAELLMELADLMVVTAGLKIEMADLLQKSAQLRNRITDLQKKKDIRAKMKYRANLYWPTTPIEGYGNGPFCAACFDDGTLRNVRQMRYDDVHATCYAYYCYKCERTYYVT